MHISKKHTQNWEPWSSPTFLTCIRDAGVTIQVVGHFPAPVWLPEHGHLGPSVYPHIVFPDLSSTNKTGNDRVTAFMTTPYLVTRICSLAPIWMEVSTHGRAGSLPVRIKISPIVWSPLKARLRQFGWFDFTTKGMLSIKQTTRLSQA